MQLSRSGVACFLSLAILSLRELENGDSIAARSVENTVESLSKLAKSRKFVLVTEATRIRRRIIAWKPAQAAVTPGSKYTQSAALDLLGLLLVYKPDRLRQRSRTSERKQSMHQIQASQYTAAAAAAMVGLVQEWNHETMNYASGNPYGVRFELLYSLVVT